MSQSATGAVDEAGLKGLHVLCLRAEGDHSGLDALLAAATQEFGWQVETLRPDLSPFCQKQGFEADDAAVAATDALIGDCERLSGIPAGAILVGGTSDLGRGFSVADFNAADGAVAREVLADNAAPFPILRRLFALARDRIEAAKPDLVIVCGRADPLSLVLRLVAKHRGIGAFALRPSRLWDGRCYWTDSFDGLNPAALAVAARKRSAHAAVSTLAQNHVANARSLQPDDPERAAPDASRYLYLALREEAAIADSPPPFWANQYYLAELICSSLPAGYKLLIQDHPGNSGRRPARYTRDLSRLPGVVLIDRSEDAAAYIGKASLVVTDDGPAGWQALLLGRPVITLADNFYAGADLAHRVYNPERLAATVVHLLAPTLARNVANDPRKLGWLLDAEWETSAPANDPTDVLRLLDLARRAPVDGHAKAGKENEFEPKLDTVSSLHDSASLQGRRVLAVLPLGNKDLGKYLIGLMAAGKERLGWSVSVLSSTADTRSFARLVAPQGEIFVQPPLLGEADWESDPQSTHAVDRTIRDAESKTGLPLGRVILAAGHSIGRAYSAPFHYFNRYPMLMRVLRNNEEPHRIARRLFRFADDVLERNKPDVLFFYHWGTPLNLLTWLAAQRRGIPCVVLRPSKIWPDCAFLTTDRLMWNTRAGERARARIGAGAPASDAAREKISSFRSRPVMIKYIASKWTNRMNLGFFRWHKQYARIVMNQVMNRFRGQDRSTVEGVFARFARYYRTLFLTWYQQRVFTTFDPAELDQLKYVYFPLHKEAELAQTFQASTWHDQRQTVRAIAGALPFGYRLLVREHRLNYGRRRTQAYRELAQLPNVTLLDPFDSQYKYLRHADLVVTENGSTGWEALLLKRRTLLLAEHTFYAGSGLGATVTDPDELQATVVDLLSKPPVADEAAHDHALASMIDAEFETTFPMKPEGFDAALDAFAAILAPHRESAREPRTAVAAGS